MDDETAVHFSGVYPAMICKATGQIGVLIGQAVPLMINDPAYTYTRLPEKRVDMPAKATQDARSRAGAIARQADLVSVHFYQC